MSAPDTVRDLFVLSTILSRHVHRDRPLKKAGFGASVTSCE